jgi:intein/homing endonuclease
MRIFLKKGYQRKLVLLAKNNFTWSELSHKISLSQGYLRNALLKEEASLEEKVYKKLCEIADINFDKFIFQKKEDNWGQSKGGNNSGSFREPKLLIEKPSEELAELVGIILGDGNIYCKRGYYYVRIAGDLKKDKDYLSNYVKPLFEKVFGYKMHFIEQRKYNCLYISIGNKDVVHTLKYFGLKSGDKLKNNVRIPKWVFKSDKYLRACIRGLIDTDGSICPITGRDYPYIWFTSAILNLRRDFSLAMKKLGIKTSRWNLKEGRTPDIYI